MKNNIWHLFLKLPQLLKTEPPDADQHAMRIRFMECHIGLPIRAVITTVLFYYIFYTRWHGATSCWRGVKRALHIVSSRP